MVTTNTGLKFAEIKPSNPKGEKDGIEDVRWYRQKLEETYPNLTIEPLDERISVGNGIFMPDPIATAAECPQQRIGLAPMRVGLYGYWCAPPFSEVRKECACGRRRRKPEAKQLEKSEAKSKEQRKPVHVAGYDPYFEDYAIRLPQFDAPPDQDFIVAINSDIHKATITDAARRRLRPMQVDPRGVTPLQVPLIGPAMLLAPIELVFFAMVAPEAIPESVGAAATLGEAVTTAATVDVGVPAIAEGGEAALGESSRIR